MSSTGSRGEQCPLRPSNASTSTPLPSVPLRSFGPQILDLMAALSCAKVSSETGNAGARGTLFAYVSLRGLTQSAWLLGPRPLLSTRKVLGSPHDLLKIAR